MGTLRALWTDESGAAVVEYAIVAAGIALPLLGIGAAIAASAGAALSTTTGGLQQLGTTPP